MMSLFGLPVVTDTGGCAKPFQVGVVLQEVVRAMAEQQVRSAIVSRSSEEIRSVRKTDKRASELCDLSVDGDMCMEQSGYFF